MALTSVVNDVGADRGILVSQKGFQASAVRAAEHTNVTFTSLEELKQTAQNHLGLAAPHLPGPEQAEASPMPRYNCFSLDDGQSRAPVAPETGQTDPQETIPKS